MIRPRSLQHTYDEFWSGDEAFAQPPDPPSSTREQDPAAWAAWDEQFAEHQLKVKVARDTGAWDALRVDGSDEPTKFVLRPVPGDVFRKVVDAVSQGEVGGTEAVLLLFRLALVEVVNLAGVREVKRAKHPRFGDMAGVEVPNLLDRVNPAIVGEIGTTIRDRAMGVLPLL